MTAFFHSLLASALTASGSALLLAPTVAAEQARGGMLGVDAQIPPAVGAAEFGRRLAAAHDFDRDGARDFLASWTLASTSIEVGVFSSRSGALLQQLSLPRYRGSYATESLASITDVDGDGVPEVAIGEQHFDEYYFAGAVTLYSGATGAVLWQVHHVASGDHLGAGLANVGDVDLDGYEDLLAHAPSMREAVYPYRRGGAILLSGVDGSELRRVYVSDQTHEADGETRVARAGDVDRDGVPDLLVSGVPRYGPYTGEAVVFSGATGAVLIHSVGLNSGHSYGASVCFAGDVDRDGHPDHAVAEPTVGFVRVISGRDGSVLRAYSGLFLSGFGIGMSGGSDLDGDAIPDLLIPEWEENLLHVFSGAEGTEMLTIGGFYGTDHPGPQSCMIADADGDGRIAFAWSGFRSHLSGHPPGSGFVRVGEFYPCIRASSATVRSGAGGLVSWELDFPSSEAGMEYLLLASGHGATPTPFEGTTVPLVQDRLFVRMLTGAPRAFRHPRGVLDIRGDAIAELFLAPGSAAAFLGSSVWFAAVSGPSGTRSASSIAVPLTILP